MKILTDNGYEVVSPGSFSNRQIASVISSTVTATITYVATRVIHSQGMIDQLGELEKAKKLLEARRDAIKRAVDGNNRNN